MHQNSRFFFNNLHAGCLVTLYIPENNAHILAGHYGTVNFLIIQHMQTFTQSFLVKIGKFNHRGRHTKNTDFRAQNEH